MSLFILASGLTFLETAANPYITVLGKPESSEFRLNLSQSFNGVGAFIGPIIGANLFFATGSGGNLDTVKYVYLVIAGIVFLVALLFIRTSLPEIKEEKLVSDVEQDIKPLFSHEILQALSSHSFFMWRHRLALLHCLLIIAPNKSSQLIIQKHPIYFQ